MHGGGLRQETIRREEVVELFEKEYPWITVECEFVGWDQYFDNLSTQIAAGDMPDILQHDYRYLETYVNKDLLLPLDEFVGEEIDLSDVDESYLSGGMVNDKMYGLSMGMNTFAVEYDETTFEKYGVEVPAQDWTYEDFVDVCRQFKENGIYGCDLTNLRTGHYIGLEQKGQLFIRRKEKGLDMKMIRSWKSCFRCV